MDHGVHTNGIEWPVVPIRQARLRVTIMPQHTIEHLDTFVSTFHKAFLESTQIFEKSMKDLEERQNLKNTKM